MYNKFRVGTFRILIFSSLFLAACEETSPYNFVHEADVPKASEIEAFESRFLARTPEKFRSFPPLESYDIAAITLGADDPVCEDMRSIANQNLLPQNKGAPKQIEDLPGYEAVYLDLHEPRTDLLASLPESAPEYGRITIGSPFVKKLGIRTTINMVDFETGPKSASILITAQASSWRGFGGKIVLLKDQNAGPDFFADMSGGELSKWLGDDENAVIITDDFVAQDSKIIIAPDGRLFLKRLKDRSGYIKFFKIPDNPMRMPPRCEIKWGQSISKEKALPNLTAYTNTLWRIQGASSGGGTMQSHRRLQLKTAQAVRDFYAEPWKPDRPYNNSSGLKAGLRGWSIRTPWSRREYLRLLSTYDAAYSDTAAHIEEIYGRPLSDELTAQSVYALTGHYFVFPASYDRRSQAATTQNDIAPYKQSYISRIYEQDVSAKEIKTHLNMIKSAGDEELTPEAKSAILHSNFAASLYNSKIFNAVLKSGLVPVDVPNNYGKTTLMFAVHLNMGSKASALINAGADVNAVTDPSRQAYQVTTSTPRSVLDYAVENAEFEVIKMLLDNGAELAPRLQGKYTPESNSVEEIMNLNPLLNEAQIAVLKNTIAERVVTQEKVE